MLLKPCAGTSVSRKPAHGRHVILSTRRLRHGFIALLSHRSRSIFITDASGGLCFISGAQPAVMLSSVGAATGEQRGITDEFLARRLFEEVDEAESRAAAGAAERLCKSRTYRDATMAESPSSLLYEVTARAEAQMKPSII